MDKELLLHGLQVYEILVMNYKGFLLVILNKLLDQKYLNPKMMNETKSDEVKKQDLISKS